MHEQSADGRFLEGVTIDGEQYLDYLRDRRDRADRQETIDALDEAISRVEGRVAVRGSEPLEFRLEGFLNAIPAQRLPGTRGAARFAGMTPPDEE